MLKSKIFLTKCGMSYLKPEQTFVQKMVRVGWKFSRSHTLLSFVGHTHSHIYSWTHTQTDTFFCMVSLQEVRNLPKKSFSLIEKIFIDLIAFYVGSQSLSGHIIQISEGVNCYNQEVYLEILWNEFQDHYYTQTRSILFYFFMTVDWLIGEIALVWVFKLQTFDTVVPWIHTENLTTNAPQVEIGTHHVFACSINRACKNMMKTNFNLLSICRRVIEVHESLLKCELLYLYVYTLQPDETHLTYTYFSKKQNLIDHESVVIRQLKVIYRFRNETKLLLLIVHIYVFEPCLGWVGLIRFIYYGRVKCKKHNRKISDMVWDTCLSFPFFV